MSTLNGLNSLLLIDRAGTLLIQLMFGSSVLLVAASICVWAGRHASAAVKHRLWSLGIVALLPFIWLSPLLPEWGTRWSIQPVTFQAQAISSLPDPAQPEIETATEEPAEPIRVEIRQPAAVEDPVSQNESATPPLSTRRSHAKTIPPQPPRNEAVVRRDVAQIWPVVWRITVLAWLSGVAIGLGACVAGHLVAYRVVRRAVAVEDGELLLIRDEIAARLGLSNSISIRCSPEVSVPLATGIIAPTVLLPTGYGHWDREQLRMTLAHEMAHLARRDVLWQTLAHVACCIYWTQPVLWLAAWRMRVEREHASDDVVLAIGAPPAAYASLLVVMASSLRGSSRPVPAMVAMAAHSDVETRVRAVLKSDASRVPVSRRLALCLLAVTTAVTILTGLFRPSWAQTPVGQKPNEQAASEAQASAKKSGAQPATPSSATQPAVPHIQVSGSVVDEAGRPVAGVTVTADYSSGTASKITSAEGTFALSVPTSRLPGLHFVTEVDQSRRVGYLQLPYDKQFMDSLGGLKIQLKPARRAEIRVQDAQGKPISGAMAGILANHTLALRHETDSSGKVEIWLPAEVDVTTAFAWKSKVGFDYRNFYDLEKYRQKQPQTQPDFTRPMTLWLTGATPLRVTLLDAETDAPVSGAGVYLWLLQKPGESDDINLSSIYRDLSITTNAAGEAHFDWLPNWVPDDYSLTFWPQSAAYASSRRSYLKSEGGDGLTMRLDKLVPMRGMVRLPDGSPASGIKLTATSGSQNSDVFDGSTTTRQDGSYELKARPNQVYLIVVEDSKWAAEPRTEFGLKPGQPIEKLDFDLLPATRLFGRVTWGQSRQPVAGQRIDVQQYGENLQNIPSSKESRYWGYRGYPIYRRSAMTDQDGRYEIFVGPGTYDIREPSQLQTHRFVIRQETSREFNFDSPRAAEGRLQGSVTTSDASRPAAKAHITGVYQHWPAGLRDFKHTTDDQGKFDAVRQLHAMVWHVQSADGSLARIVELGPDDTAVNISLKPVVSATGRLMDEATQQPLSGHEILYGVSIDLGKDVNVDRRFSPRNSFGGSVKTDSNGKFRINQLAVGGAYELVVKGSSNPVVITARKGVTVVSGTKSIGTVTPREGDSLIDLGDLESQRVPQPATLEGRIAREFYYQQSAKTRYQDSQRDVKLGHVQMLLLFADPQAETTKQFFKLRFDDAEVRSSLDNYSLTPLATDDVESKTLAAELKIALPTKGEGVLHIIDERGYEQATVRLGELLTKGTIDKQLLLSVLKKYAVKPLDARELLNAALKKAKAENKRVLVVEAAIWSEPCWALTRFLDKQSTLVSKDYILVQIDQRWKHCEEVMRPLRTSERRGIPWFAILDAEGQRLSTSDGPNGNIEFPSRPEEIAHFLQMLSHTRIRLTDDDLGKLKAALQQ